MADVIYHDGYVLQSWKDIEGDASEYGPKVWLSGGSVNLESGDIEIGAVEIKDATSTNRAGVTSEGNVYVELRDSAGNDRGVGVNSDNELKVQVNSDVHDDCNLNANIQVGDSDVANGNPVPVSDAGSSLTVDIGALEQTTSTFYNKTLTVADTEYVQALPTNTKALQFQCRTANDIRYAFETGKVATPTSPYSTLKSHAVWYKENILSSGSLYLASSDAGVVVEVETWS